MFKKNYNVIIFLFFSWSVLLRWFYNEFLMMINKTKMDCSHRAMPRFTASWFVPHFLGRQIIPRCSHFQTDLT